MKFIRKLRTEISEREKMARLEQAEEDLRELKDRARRAVHTLDARQEQNHWRESIVEMIQGAP